MNVAQAYAKYCKANGIDPEGQFSNEDGFPIFQAGWNEAMETVARDHKKNISTREQLKNLAPGSYIVTGEASAELSRQMADSLTKEFANKKKP